MSVIDLGEEGLLCYSPVPLSAQAAKELSALGQVTLVVAPNCFHHLFLSDFQHHAPSAKVFAAPGLSLKRPDLRFDGELNDSSDALWASALDRRQVDGAPRMNESVFFHRSSRTLLVADLVFHMTRPQGVVTHVMLGLMGVRGKLAQSRVWRMLLVKDHPAAAASCRDLLTWPIERIIPCHGEVFPLGGAPSPHCRDSLRSALGWMLSG
jgi:hypothetical protein